MRYSWLLLCLATLSVPPAYANYEKGLRALEEHDDARAAEEFLKVAGQGDHRAMMALGAMYAGGRGVPKDYVEALRWYREAARYGRSDAIYRIGLIYEGGYGTRENSREAARQFLEAAKAGFVEAQAKVGTMYRDGTVFEQNPIRAYAWLKLAGDGGHAEAGTALATLRGTLTPEQLTEAELTAADYARQYSVPKDADD